MSSPIFDSTTPATYSTRLNHNLAENPLSQLFNLIRKKRQDQVNHLSEQVRKDYVQYEKLTMLLSVLGLLDLTTTMIGLGMNWAYEANPIIAHSPLGVFPTLLIGKLVCFVLLGLGWIYYVNYATVSKWLGPTVKFQYATIIPLYLFVVVNNMIVIYKGVMN